MGGLGKMMVISPGTRRTTMHGSPPIPKRGAAIFISTIGPRAWRVLNIGSIRKIRLMSKSGRNLASR